MSNPTAQNIPTEVAPNLETAAKKPGRGLGWLWFPVGFAILVWVDTFCYSYIGWLYSIPGGDYLMLPFREIQGLALAGQGIICAGLLIAGGMLEFLSRRNTLYIWKWLVPAFLWLLTGLIFSILNSLGIRGQELSDVIRLSGALGPEGIVGGGLGIGAIGLIFGLIAGRESKCPQCGKWWSVPLFNTPLGSSVSTGGSFASDGSGWQNTRTIVNRYLRHFRCRACKHEWTAAYSSRTRQNKKSLSPFWNGDSGR